eukprot:CAMPEP_0115543580 /NCGR_PEP_ID=MMETSP0271-20121206/91631_1 /TAXON_ID=71861 /ORGANISM="Scrippsiella trochoidea, Strain CCMP3099" /LENGTH=42 /DNA_ID= /DNA_START= /DNA_END= /DNA_ORIENTATION=
MTSAGMSRQQMHIASNSDSGVTPRSPEMQGKVHILRESAPAQ